MCAMVTCGQQRENVLNIVQQCFANHQEFCSAIANVYFFLCVILRTHGNRSIDKFVNQIHGQCLHWKMTLSNEHATFVMRQRGTAINIPLDQCQQRRQIGTTPRKIALPLRRWGKKREMPSKNDSITQTGSQ